MKTVLILSYITLLSTSCNWLSNSCNISPMCSTWGDVANYLPTIYYSKLDMDTPWVSSHMPIRKEDSVCVFRCSEDVWVIIKKDNSWLEMEESNTFYEEIYIMDNGSVIHSTAFPASYGYEVSETPSELAITFNYIYRKRYYVLLRYIKETGELFKSETPQ